MRRFHANFLLLLISLIWGSAFVGQSVGMKALPPFAFTGLRFLLGFCVISPLIWRDWQTLRQQHKKPDRRDFMSIVAMGTLLTLGSLLQQIGISNTNVTNAGFLTALYVPLVPIFSRLLLREKVHIIVWPAAFGCLIGTWLLAGGSDEFILNRGDKWIILSSFFWALHVLFIGRVAARLNTSFLVAGGQFLICGVSSLVLSALFESMSLASIGKGITQAVWPIIYTGALSVGFAFTAQVVVQRYTDAPDIAIILSAETLFAALFGYLLLGERRQPLEISGGVLIFICILAVQLWPLWRARQTARLK